MPRGRQHSMRPSPASPPADNNDHDALIDAAFREWSAHRLRQQLRKEAEARVIPWPDAEVTRKSVKGRSWIDSRNHPHHPDDMGRPVDPGVTFVVRAVAQLRGTGMTLYGACGYVADRLLTLFPRKADGKSIERKTFVLALDILQIDRTAISGARTPAEAHSLARQVLINRFKRFCR